MQADRAAGRHRCHSGAAGKRESAAPSSRRSPRPTCSRRSDRGGDGARAGPEHANTNRVIPSRAARPTRSSSPRPPPMDAIASDPPSAVVPTPQGAPEPQGNSPFERRCHGDRLNRSGRGHRRCALLATEEAVAPQVEMSTAPAPSPTALDEPMAPLLPSAPPPTCPHPPPPVHMRLAKRRSSLCNPASASKRPARPASRRQPGRAGGWQPRSPPRSLPCLRRQRCWWSSISRPWAARSLCPGCRRCHRPCRPTPAWLPSVIAKMLAETRGPAGPVVTDDALLSRYREVWPAGW